MNHEKQTRRILIVEDDEHWTKILRRSCEHVAEDVLAEVGSSLDVVYEVLITREPWFAKKLISSEVFDFVSLDLALSEAEDRRDLTGELIHLLESDIGQDGNYLGEVGERISGIDLLEFIERTYEAEIERPFVVIVSGQNPGFALVTERGGHLSYEAKLAFKRERFEATIKSALLYNLAASLFRSLPRTGNEEELHRVEEIYRRAKVVTTSEFTYKDAISARYAELGIRILQFRNTHTYQYGAMSFPNSTWCTSRIAFGINGGEDDLLIIRTHGYESFRTGYRHSAIDADLAYQVKLLSERLFDDDRVFYAQIEPMGTTELFFLVFAKRLIEHKRAISVWFSEAQKQFYRTARHHQDSFAETRGFPSLSMKLLSSAQYNYMDDFLESLSR